MTVDTSGELTSLLRHQAAVILSLESRLLSLEQQQGQATKSARSVGFDLPRPTHCRVNSVSSNNLPAASPPDGGASSSSTAPAGVEAPSSPTRTQHSRARTVATSATVSGREPDPFKSMWAKSRFDEERQMFERSMLRSIHNKADKSCRNRGARWGLGILGLLSMPFGPIGILGGGVLGALVGGIVGALFDARGRRRKKHDLELETRKLRSLIRWASDSSHKDEDIPKLVEMVTLEFKPMADVAPGSANACKLLRLLDKWISQKRVTRQLWIYMDVVLQDWRGMNQADFVRSILVFQTLRTMYHSVHRVFDEQELQFLQRMERLLEHQAVKSVMRHSQMYPREGDKRIAEVLVYADRSDEMQMPSQSSRRFSRGSAAQTVAPESATLVGMGSGSDPQRALEAQVPVGMSTEDMPGSDADEEQVDTMQEFRLHPGMSCSSSQSLEGPKERQRRKTLRKPFFRNWDDFMDFDINVKHKMPITLSEFELLLQKEAEPTKGWDVPIDRKEIRVAKIQSGPGVITLRAWATVPGVDMHVAFHLFYETQERTKWDKVFAQMEIVQDDVQGSDILYSLLRVPAVTPRDFLQYRRVKLQKDGSILIVLRSAEHQGCPEDKNNIRAESHISGYVLRQEFEGKTPILKIFLMSCADIKGLIPKWIVNHFAPRKPGEWVEGLRKAAVGYQEAHPDFKVALQRKAERFAAENPFDFEPDDTDEARGANDPPLNGGGSPISDARCCGASGGSAYGEPASMSRQSSPTRQAIHSL